MDIRERIAGLASAAGIGAVPADRCWVDARARCPYGYPEGQYVLRPEGSCNSGCRHFTDNGAALYAESDLNRQAGESLRERFDEHHTNTANELAARAQELSDGSPERLVLELAADIVRDSERKLNRDILLREDLPEE
jgi:hypothetical protein